VGKLVIKNRSKERSLTVEELAVLAASLTLADAVIMYGRGSAVAIEAANALEQLSVRYRRSRPIAAKAHS
jgi:hypothetical protein